MSNREKQIKDGETAATQKSKSLPEEQAKDSETAAPRVDKELPSIIIDQSSDIGDRASGFGGTKTKHLKAGQNAIKKPKDKGKIPMPSQQAGKLTTAFNTLVELRRAKSAEGIVLQAIRRAQKELEELNDKLADIQPESELQQKFKDSWIAKNVARKEQYITQLVKTLQDREESEEESSSCTSSQLDQAAAEEEALLLLEQEQMLRRQELHRRQREEERKEQQERDELQRRLLEVRSRASSRSRASMSRGNSPNRSVRALPSRLSRVHHPTPAWLEDASAPENGVNGQQIHSAAPVQGGNELIQQMFLGQAKIPCFSGDQLEYLWFRQAFEVQVERVTDDPVQRLYRLLQCLEGEPHRLVRACQLADDAEEGFKRAKELLNERYGHPVRQALAFKGKLLSWPSIKSTSDLTNFSIHLQQCKHARMGGSKMAELDAASTLLMLAAKLPEKLQFSWQTKVVDIEQNREVVFEDFVKFVHRHETAWSHPVFGKLRTDKRGGGAVPPASVNVYSTQAGNPNEIAAQDPIETVLKTSASVSSNNGQRQNDRTNNAFKAPCLFCKGDHSASKCKSTGITREQKRVALTGLCFSCLKPGHTARFCRNRLKCDICGGLHPTTLHEDRIIDTNKTALTEEHALQSQASALPEEEQTPDEVLKENSLFTQGSRRYAMATVKVRLWTQDKTHSINVTALLDGASSATFVSKEVVSFLGGPSRAVRLNLSTMSGETEKQTSVLQGLKVADLDLNNVLHVGVAYVVEALPDVNVPVSLTELNGWPHLSDVSSQLPSCDEPIKMLIGQNVHGAHIPGDVRKGGDDEPFAVKFKLGWALQGPIGDKGSSVECREIVNFVRVSKMQIEEQLQRLYYQDFAQAYDFAAKGPSQEDREWLQLVENSTRRMESGHLCIGLPFRREARSNLRDNRDQAISRLRQLKRKFVINPTFRADYVGFVNKMIEAGHVERVPDAQVHVSDGQINYIPHHGVYHLQKKKIRVVFNCANRYQGLSLNYCLLSGPDLTNSIIGVLCRFRQFQVAFAADIEAMFYQVFVPEAQRDCLRFLWWDEGGIEQDKVATYRMRVHLFGATSSPSVANYALRRAADGDQTRPEIKSTILRNFYVDDCLKSMDTTEKAVTLAKGLVQACAQNGFKLSKFVSSDISFLQSFNKQQLAKALEEVDLSENKEDPLGSLQERALGVTWNVKEDRLGFRVQHKENETRVTKRSVLARISQVYDPLGMAAPVIIVARMFFRHLTKNGPQSWDDSLNNDDAERWHRWTTELPQLETSSIERWMGLRDKGGESYQLHAFCDASANAYAAAVYIRRAPKKFNEKAQVSFVFGKARVSPPKVVTIPRMELTAAKLAAELIHTIQGELEVTIESKTIWSDSQAVIKYINNQKKRFHVFVANRVEAILSKTKAKEWRYVPTHLNPADQATRGLCAEALNGSSWLQGPDFLREPEALWPAEETCLDIAEEDPEIKRSEEVTHLTQIEENDCFIERLAERYSEAWKFRRAVAVWLQLKCILRKKASARPPFQAEELRKAEMESIKWLQFEYWSQEMQSIKQNQRPTAWLRTLMPKIINDVLVMQSRVGVNLPIIPDGSFAKLLVREAHVSEGHMGKQATSGSVRRKYWIIHLSKIAHSIVKQCASCQRRRPVLGRTQMSDLPDMRLIPGPPFQTTGVDFFGPFLVRNAGVAEPVKAYGVIFSCAVSRAIHLELADGLDVSSFINTLRRFCARRGQVETLVSDNASNFSGACDTLQEEIAKIVRANCKDPAVIVALREKAVNWHFIPPTASHFGGFYERLIRCVREVLTALLEPRGRHTPLTTDSLTTLLCECESILNNRPLTTVSNDPKDLEALTPNHLLLGQPNVSALLPGSYNDISKALRNRWRLVQHLTREFWKRWTTEYKTLLHKRQKWFESIRRPFRINDVVLFNDSSKAISGLGQLGRITNVYPSKDGEVRVVDVLTAKGTFTRPITKLCLLETASNSS